MTYQNNRSNYQNNRGSYNPEKKAENHAVAIRELNNAITSIEPEFMRLLRADYIDFNQEYRHVMGILEKSSYLADICMKQLPSFRSAMYQLSTLGLSMNPTLGHAYLVPRKVDGVVHPFLDVGYKGLSALAIESKLVTRLDAELVYSGDGFSFDDIYEKPNHKFNPYDPERGDLMGAYCVARLNDGTFKTEHMPLNEIERARDASESWRSKDKRNYSPWFNWFNEMAKKTVIKRASKTWPRGLASKPTIFDEAVDYLNEKGEEGIATAPVTEVSIDEIREKVIRVVDNPASTNDDLRAIWDDYSDKVSENTPEWTELKQAINYGKKRLHDRDRTIDMEG